MSGKVKKDKDNLETDDEHYSTTFPDSRLTFADILLNRYLPILSITYIACVIGLALKRGSGIYFFNYLLGDETSYFLAFLVAAWVSIPAIIWISMRGVGALTSYANNWYKSTTIIMVLVLFASFLLFPPNGQGSEMWYTARLFVAAAIPIHIIQYWFFTKGGLPTNYSAVLGVIALTLFLYGVVVL